MDVSDNSSVRDDFIYRYVREKRRRAMMPMNDVINNDDLLSYIFINWVDPKSCLALLLVNKRFNALYRLRVPGPIESSIYQHCIYNFDLVRWSVDMGMPVKVILLEEAASAGGVGGMEALQWFNTRTVPSLWGADVCTAAAEGGNLDVLQWLHGQKLSFGDGWTCAAAAGGGHLEILQWLRRRPPCPWAENTCAQAAKNSHLEVLQWLRSQNPPCPWDQRACLMAAEGG